MRHIYILLLLIFGVSKGVSAQSFSDIEFNKLRDQIRISGNSTIEERLINMKSQEVMTSYDRARIESLLAKYYARTNQFAKVIECEGYLDIIAELEENSSEEAYEYMLNLTSSFVFKGMFSKGLELLVICERYAKKQSGREEMALINQHYASIYYNQGHLDKALESLEASEVIYNEIDNKVALSAITNNMAVLYRVDKQYSKALEYNNKALSLSEELMDTISISESYNNIGKCYHSLFKQDLNPKDLQQAIKYFELSSDIKSRYPHINNTAMSNLGQIYDELSEIDIAEELYKDATANAEKNRSWRYLIEIYRDREITETRRGNLEAAIKFANKRANILQKLDEVNRRNSIDEIEVQKAFFESKEKAAQHKRRLHNTLFFTILLTVLIVAGTIFSILKTRNRRLKFEQKRTLLENRVLTAQMNPHFIFNALAAIQNSLLQNDPLQTAQYLSRFAKMIRLTFDMTQRERISLREELDVLSSYIDVQKMRFQDRFIFKVDIDSDIDIYNYMIPTMLLQPLVENSIDHGFKDIDYQGVLTLEVKRVDGAVLFKVINNGVGFDADLESKKLHALDILQQRLDLIGKSDRSFKISRGVNGVGTEVKFILRDA